MKKSGYQIMTSILTNYSPTDEEIERISPFFFCRYLSNHPRAVHISNVFNRYYKEIPLKIQYKISKQLLKGKIKFIQFPKNEKNKDKVLENIAKYYKISYDLSKEYIELLSEEEIEKFSRLYDGA